MAPGSDRAAYVLALALLASGCASPAQPPPERQPVTLVRVIDGDTIRVRLAGAEERVRYIGVDTPERDERCFVAATEANERLLRKGRLKLEFDRERRDRYGRLLAYVYAGRTFVNLELLRRGLAEPVVIEPNDRHATLFIAAGNLSRRCG
jgi:micrococcal nuclease